MRYFGIGSLNTLLNRQSLTKADIGEEEKFFRYTNVANFTAWPPLLANLVDAAIGHAILWEIPLLDLLGHGHTPDGDGCSALAQHGSGSASYGVPQSLRFTWRF